MRVVILFKKSVYRESVILVCFTNNKPLCLLIIITTRYTTAVHMNGLLFTRKVYTDQALGLSNVMTCVTVQYHTAIDEIVLVESCKCTCNTG